MTIRFGTDGWRGVIAQDFTFDNVRRCAQGVVGYVKGAGMAGRGLVIGYDTRFASEEFARACAEVVASQGIKAYLTPKPLPTPVISFSIPLKGAAGAIIITASHNPYLWNGFKFKTDTGSPAPTAVERKIEEGIGPPPPPLPLESALTQGMVEYFDPTPAYFQHLASLVDLPALKAAPLKVVVDSMYGAGAGFLPSLLSGGKLELQLLHQERNPLFPGLQPEPIELNLRELSARVKEWGAGVGLATDGDADRLGVVDERGQFINPLQVFPLLALHFLETKGQRGPLVKTIPCSRLVERLGEAFAVPVYETPVGFKYVAPLMLEKKALIGGEESGGYGFRGHVLERDGILAGLLFLELMVSTGKTPSQLVADLYQRFGHYHYRRLDLRYPASERERIVSRLEASTQLAGLEVREVRRQDGFRFLLADGSWLYIRFSGTEPLLRLYAESPREQKLAQLLEAGKELVGI